MCDQIMELPDRTKFQILAPAGKRYHRKPHQVSCEGFVRIRINGEVELSDLD